MAALRLLLVAALLALPIWVAQTSPAQACTCVPGESADPIAADLIGVGTVTDLRLSMPVSPVPADIAPYQIPQADVEWTVMIEEYIKGSGPEALNIRSNTSVTAGPGSQVTFSSGTTTLCGFAPERNARLLLFLSGSGPYQTGGCSSNRELLSENEADARARIAQIRAAVAAEPAGLPPTGSGPLHRSAPIGPIAAAFALAVLGLAANAAFVLRRRSS